MLAQLEIEIVTHPLPFRLNHVNCFLAEGKEGHVVIDTGLHRKETIALWEDVLQNKEVEDILITHYHPDHFGYAGKLQERSDANVSMSRIDATNSQAAWGKDLLTNLLDKYRQCGIPEETSQAMLQNTEDFIPRVTPFPKVNHFYEEYERFKIGKYEYEVIFTPGHSDGLVTFFNEEKKVLLSTDHILPRITPNISYWFYGDQNPLKTYIQSLEKVRKLDAEYVIPSHGKPFYDANQRIDEIIAHHEERLDATLAHVPKHPTVHTLCEALFDFELTVHETRFAIGETIAHLEYLKQRGEVTRSEIDGIWHYERT